MLLVGLILVNLIITVSTKSFGHAVEYRFEYDPSKSERPVVEWRYDNLLEPRYPNSDSNIRKAPQRPYHFPDGDSRDRAYNGRKEWDNYSPYSGRFEHKDLADAMSAILRQRSEEILNRQLSFPLFQPHRPQFHYLSENEFPEWFV